MSESATSFNNKRRRVFVASVSLLALFAAGGVVLGVIENIRDAVDRAH